MTTLEPSQPTLFEETELPLTSSAVGSRARIFQTLEHARGWVENAAVYGQRSFDLLASFDLASCSWRTLQHCLVAQLNNQADGLDEFSATWPRSGMMRNGTAYRLPPLVQITSEIVSGSLPTPTRGFHDTSKLGGQAARPFATRRLPTLTRHGNYNRKGASATSGDGLATVLSRWLPTLTSHDVRGGALPERTTAMLQDSHRGCEIASTMRMIFPETTGIINPSWAEGYMGFPIGWTELDASAMPSCRKSRNSSGTRSSMRKA